MHETFWILDLSRWDLPQAETLIDLTTKIKAQQGENLSDLCVLKGVSVSLVAEDYVG